MSVQAIDLDRYVVAQQVEALHYTEEQVLYTPFAFMYVCICKHIHTQTNMRMLHGFGVSLIDMLHCTEEQPFYACVV
jgi:hypothetical protein